MPTRPDRNLAIERLLREGHAALAGADAGACITAEEVAAWVEGGLSAGDASRIEAHLASCQACQALLSAFARTEPAAAVSRSHGVTRVLLPFAAAAVLVVGVWLAGTRQQPASVTAPAERELARVDQLPATPATPVRPATPAQPAEDSALRRAARQPSATLGRSDASRGQTAAPRPVSMNEPAQDAAPAEQKAVAAAPPAAVMPAPAEAPQAAADTTAQADAIRRPQGVSSAPERARLESLSASARVAPGGAADARLPIASPDGASRWRIVGNALEVSADGGVSWLPAAGVTPAELADVTSGASPARSVSWLVGRGGLVLLTTDGRRFTRSTSPAPALLTAVEAVDGVIAVVRASDGRAWRTVNAGRTWMPVQ